MVGLGLLFVLLGSLSIWIADDTTVINDRAFDMDMVGLIFLIVGVIGLLLGMFYASAGSFTSHREDVHVLKEEVEVEEEPVVEKKVVKRKPRKKA